MVNNHWLSCKMIVNTPFIKWRGEIGHWPPTVLNHGNLVNTPFIKWILYLKLFQYTPLIKWKKKNQMATKKNNTGSPHDDGNLGKSLPGHLTASWHWPLPEWPRQRTGWPKNWPKKCSKINPEYRAQISKENNFLSNKITEILTIFSEHWWKCKQILALQSL